MPAGNKVKINIIDQNGKSCDTGFFVASTVQNPDDDGIQEIVDAVQDLIDGAAVANLLELADNAPVAGGAIGAGYNAADKMRMIARSRVDGSTVIIDLPSPGVTNYASQPYFNTDGSVVQTQQDIADIITFINNNAKDSNGNAVTWVSGRRTRSQGLKTAF